MSELLQIRNPDRKTNALGDLVNIPEDHADECRHRGPDRSARQQLVRSASSAMARDMPTRTYIYGF